MVGVTLLYVFGHVDYEGAGLCGLLDGGDVALLDLGLLVDLVHYSDHGGSCLGLLFLFVDLLLILFPLLLPLLFNLCRLNLLPLPLPLQIPFPLSFLLP